MFQFIFSRIFLKQTALALAVVAVVLMGTYYYLKSYARTGEAIEVPDLSGYDVVEAESLLKPLNLAAQVVDSIHIEGRRGGEIVDQQPHATSLVKSDRKIYVTVTRYIVPQTKLPNVVNQGLALAQAKLVSYGFKIGKLIPRPDPCTGCAIGFEAGGKTVEVGTKLRKGSTINIIVGQKEDGALVSVPVLFGLSVDEAQTVLLNHNLNLGATLVHDATTPQDSASARVYWQSASAGDQLPMGSAVNIYLTTVKGKIPDTNLDSLKALVK